VGPALCAVELGVLCVFKPVGRDLRVVVVGRDLDVAVEVSVLVLELVGGYTGS
jgi:hypothetical protein